MSDAHPEMPQRRPDIPTATYRLQFNKDFTFRQARDIVPYLNELGISHCYASPYFQTAQESAHGYDIADHNQLSPAIGTREEYDAFVAELHRFGLGQIVDFVPNHMGIGELNQWWMDVLENGPSSVYAPYFDIDWHPLKEELERQGAAADPRRPIRARAGKRGVQDRVRKGRVLRHLLHPPPAARPAHLFRAARRRARIHGRGPLPGASRPRRMPCRTPHPWSCRASSPRSSTSPNAGTKRPRKWRSAPGRKRW